jgi:hypothetical protein
MTSNISDTPFQLKNESLQLKIELKPGVPNVGQATVSWNIPPALEGCDSTNSQYCGMVVLLCSRPLGAEHIPQDGVQYVSDSTASTALHVGDKIGDALVIGAFYEGVKKSRGEALTTSFIINDFASDSAVYVAGYSVDCQLRYHSDGIRAYSDNFGKTDEQNYPSYQLVYLNNNEGALLTDGTGLIPGVMYSFELHYTDKYPYSGEVYKIDIDTNDAGTYEDLINQINEKIALSLNPLISPVAPYTGSYYWNPLTDILSIWNGESYVQSSVIIENTDPSIVVDGSYWSNDQQLYKFDTLLGWEVTPFLSLSEDPTEISSCNHIWFNGTTSYRWNGTTWCELITYIQPNDPSCPPVIECGTYWYDTNAESLYSFKNNSWNKETAFYWNVAPNALVVNTYWLDILTDVLNRWDGTQWVEITNHLIRDTEPTTSYPNGTLWYDPTAHVLYQYNDTTDEWDEQILILWDYNPSYVASCTLWWNSVNDKLYVWDVIHSEWDEVVNFLQQTQDPRDKLSISVETSWYDTSSNKLFLWDGVDWIEQQVISHNTDPNTPAINSIWLNTSTDMWYIWDGMFWIVIDPINSLDDPTSIPPNTLWFDTTNDELNQRVGASWVNIPYTLSPVSIPKGQLWYDTTNDLLKEWSYNKWIPAIVPITASLNTKKHLQFTTTKTGSNIGLSILTENLNTYGSGLANFAQGDTGYPYGGNNVDKFLDSVQTQLQPEQFLFNFVVGAQLGAMVIGSDGVSGTPSYKAIGVGDDGTPDERRALHTAIKEQLGYPMVDVELTQSQLDIAIRKALDVYRQRSSVSYKKGFFFLDINPGQQRYVMSNKTIGFNKIVNVMVAYRFNAAFLSSAHSAGLYGQSVLQHLYTMGTYDLTSFHLISQYIETLEELFATRLMFQFNEYNRCLDFYQSFVYKERVLLECMVERTEQELLVDRIAKNWIEQYALAEAMLILAQIRGKYSTLPGAGGGVSLNASDLTATSENIKVNLLEQLDDYIAQDPENVGMVSSFILG